MSNALVTIVAPLALERLTEAEEAIAALGNPARPEIAALLNLRPGEDEGTHFASLHALRSRDGARAYIVLEFSADGTEGAALARIARAVGDHLRPVFMLASDWKMGGDLLGYMRAHQVRVGDGWFRPTGLAFAGTPGLTAGRIRREASLAAEIARRLGEQPSDLDALERVDDVRRHLEAKPEFAEALRPAAPETPYGPPSNAWVYAQIVGSFMAKYLWPAGLLVLAWALYQWSWSALWTGLGVAVALLVAGAIAVYGSLRRTEERDTVDERMPDHATQTAMFERENRFAHNHMVSVTQRKPGVVRWITSRLAFFVIGELAARSFRPGFLGDIGTIHFARWVTPPNSPDVLFFSNYGGSWESYLEDFITLAHNGLTGIWSNSIGFPRSENLFQKGATDAERFKRYARRSMVPTRFWYSAYPALTTARIRTNAEIRRGLSGAMTVDEATHWLALFGSAERPPSKLVSSEIQSLVFGGLRFMAHGACLVIQDLPENTADARAWLGGIAPHIAWNDGRRFAERPTAVVTLALGARGMARLGLPRSGLDSFPFAFLDGMASEARGRILGDVGKSASAKWLWGRTQPDAALLVYGSRESALQERLDDIAGLCARHGMPDPYRIPLEAVDKEKKHEAFGFTDGISQPVIRGTYKGMRNVDPIHLVEPGEFILGYPDNRNSIPPGPTLPATDDPDNRLPLVGAPAGFSRNVVEARRDLGFNGSFLVIRELEQDVARFNGYCESEAKRLQDRLSLPYVVNAEFIGAKMVGRWKDGSSLVRHPYEPRAKAPSLNKPTARAQSNPVAHPPIPRPAAASAEADNDFLFGAEDPEAVRCPYGAHIRRAFPRDSLAPGSADAVSIANRHRILRVGRNTAVTAEREKPGLFFMCLNSDIERQFEFVQQTWLVSPSFHGLSCEKDPILGDGDAGACDYTIPSRSGPLRLSPLPAFVRTLGGGYFFLPGKRLVEFLSAP